MKGTRHILHTITAINRGGAENHLVDLIQHQLKTGCRVSLAYLKASGYWTEKLTAAGAQVYPLGLAMYGDPRPIFKLRRLIEEKEFDLIHAHLPPAELYTRLALLFRGRKRPPLLISKHNEEPFYKGPGQKWLARWVAKRAARVIVISDAVGRYMAGPNAGIPTQKLSRIYYGLDCEKNQNVPPEAVAKVRSGWNVPEEGFLIGFVGRLVAQKDIFTLLDGFARFHSKYADSRLVIVGKGPLEDSLKSFAHQLGIGDSVIWAGFRDDISHVMAALDVFALTSHYEGFGLVLLEAMAAGVPVVGTRVGAIPEVVHAGETGVLIGPGRPEELCSAFESLLDPHSRERMGEAGRKRAEDSFGLGAMCSGTDALYARCGNARSLLKDSALSLQ
jgi:glycosyltransferase involved in cell wall biosynthesis